MAILPRGKIKLVISHITKSSKFDFVLLANRGRIFLNINEIKNVNAIPPAISIRASGTCVNLAFLIMLIFLLLARLFTNQYEHLIIGWHGYAFHQRQGKCRDQ